VDPFRDELAAAHAKIAQLEEQVRQLHVKPPSRGSAPLTIILVAILAFMLFVIGIGAAVVMVRLPR
jgi:hypothetical protein